MMKPFILFFLLLSACGTQNMAASYTDDTPDERAKRALDEGRYDEAIEIYETLIEGAPESYERYPLLSAAYAGKAGVDIVSIVKAQLEDSSGSGSVFEMMGSFVPADPSDDELAAIQLSIATLEAMPSDHRSDGSFEYSLGAAFQLTLYLAASSAMVLNQFTTAEGSFTPESLADMSDADVDAIISNLDSIIASQASGAAQEALAVLVGASNDALPRRLDACHEWRGRGIGKARQRGRRLMGEALGRELAVPDADLLETFHAPKVAVHAHSAEIEARNA